MIKSRKELEMYMKADNSNFLQYHHVKGKAIAFFSQYPQIFIKKYLYYLRKEEYYVNTAGRNKFKSVLGLFYERKKNRLGRELGIEIGANCFGKGLTIWHAGNIVVHANAQIGENCILHGGNCIGNNGISDAVPKIGNNVDIGFGAIVIGDIIISDNVTIGANAVVVKSVLKAGSMVAGVPAKEIK